MFDINLDEVLALNFSFQLHHMSDESVSTKNPRDRILRMVKSLNHKEQEINTNTTPFLVMVVEQQINTNTTPFLF